MNMLKNICHSPSKTQNTYFQEDKSTRRQYPKSGYFRSAVPTGTGTASRKSTYPQTMNVKYPCTHASVGFRMA